MKPKEHQKRSLAPQNFTNFLGFIYRTPTLSPSLLVVVFFFFRGLSPHTPPLLLTKLLKHVSSTTKIETLIGRRKSRQHWRLSLALSLSLGKREKALTHILPPSPHDNDAMRDCFYVRRCWSLRFFFFCFSSLSFFKELLCCFWPLFSLPPLCSPPKKRTEQNLQQRSVDYGGNPRRQQEVTWILTPFSLTSKLTSLVAHFSPLCVHNMIHIDRFFCFYFLFVFWYLAQTVGNDDNYLL